MNESVLIVHGLGGSGPEHWQTWLAGRLQERGVSVSYPDLPDPDEPKLDAWLDALTDELDRLGPEGLVVACHSLGAVAWLHLAARTERAAGGAGAPGRAAERRRGRARDRRVRPGTTRRRGGRASRGFDPRRLRGRRRSRTAPKVPELWEPLGVPIDVIHGAGHLNTDAGYGPWPAVEAWCLDPGSVPVTSR